MKFLQKNMWMRKGEKGGKGLYIYNRGRQFPIFHPPPPRGWEEGEERKLEKEGENKEDEKGGNTQRREIPTGQVSLRLKF